MHAFSFSTCCIPLLSVEDDASGESCRYETIEELEPSG